MDVEVEVTAGYLYLDLSYIWAQNQSLALLQVVVWNVPVHDVLVKIVLEKYLWRSVSR